VLRIYLLVQRPVCTGGLLYRSIRYAIERKQTENKIIHLASFPNNDPDPIIEIDLNGKVISPINPLSKYLMKKDPPRN